MTSEQHMEQFESLRQENKEYHTNFEGHIYAQFSDTPPIIISRVF